MDSVIEKCQKDDFEYLSVVLDSYASFTNDKQRKRLLKESESSESARQELVALIDRQIRYYGSSDIAFAKRALFNKAAGVSSEKIIDDVCNKLNVEIKEGGSIEARLKRLVNAAVEKELASKTPDDLAKSLEKIGMGDVDRDQITEKLRSNGKAAVIPVLAEFLGPKATLGVIETIVFSLTAKLIGRQAARQLLKQVMKRNPWLNSLGPILWVLSGVWITVNLQGPAYRKTVPVCLYLGLVGLRDGEEHQKLEPSELMHP